MVYYSFHMKSKDEIETVGARWKKRCGKDLNEFICGKHNNYKSQTLLSCICEDGVCCKPELHQKICFNFIVPDNGNKMYIMTVMNDYHVWNVRYGNPFSPKVRELFEILHEFFVNGDS